MPNDRPVSQQTSHTQVEEDRDDENESNDTTQKKPDNQMINITGCEFAEFEQYMIGKYGEKQFKNGFVLIRANMKTLYQDNGEEQLAQLL